MPARQSKVKVFVRMRPTDNFANDIIDIGPDNKVRDSLTRILIVYLLFSSSFKSLNIYNKRPASQGYVNNQITDWAFKVDGVLNNVSQDTVYDEVVKETTKKCVDGYNGTILCYGQTGAGKTFTMTGATENYQQRGLIPRTIQHLFKEIQGRQDQEFTIRYSTSVCMYNKMKILISFFIESDISKFITSKFLIYLQTRQLMHLTSK